MIVNSIPAGTKNGIMVVLGEGGPRALVLLGSLIAAGIIGAENYGVYGLIWVKILITWTVVEFGTGLAGMRDLAKVLDAQEGVADVVSGVLGLRVFICFGAIFYWFLLAGVSSQIALLVVICVIGLSFTADWILRATESFRQAGIAQLCGALIYLGGINLVVGEYRSVSSLLLVHAVQLSVTCVLSWLFIPKKVIRKSLIVPKVSTILRYVHMGGFFALTGALLQVGLFGFLYGVEKNYGLVTAGVLAALLRIYQLIVSISMMLAVGYFPRIARSKSDDEISSLKHLMWWVGVTLFVLFPLVVTPVALIVMGEQFIVIKDMVWWVSFGLLFASVRYGYSMSLTASHRHIETIFANSGYCIVASLGPYVMAGILESNYAGLSMSLAEFSSLLLIIVFSKLIRRKCE